MKWQGIGIVLLLVFSGCAVDPHHANKMKRFKVFVSIAPEHRNKQIYPKIRTVEIVSSHKIGQNH